MCGTPGPPLYPLQVLIPGNEKKGAPRPTQATRLKSGANKMRAIHITALKLSKSARDESGENGQIIARLQPRRCRRLRLSLTPSSDGGCARPPQATRLKRLSHRSVSGIVGALLAVPFSDVTQPIKGGASTAPTKHRRMTCVPTSKHRPTKRAGWSLPIRDLRSAIRDPKVSRYYLPFFFAVAAPQPGSLARPTSP